MGSGSKLRTLVGEHPVFLSLSPLVLMLNILFTTSSTGVTHSKKLSCWRETRALTNSERVFYSFKLGPRTPAHTLLIFPLWASFTPRKLKEFRHVLKRSGTFGGLEIKSLTVSILRIMSKLLSILKFS